jgi:DNA polymerase-3 subunit gamma/tau
VGLQADEEALELISRRAGGSMRDAQSLLDQLLAFGSDRLTADQVHHLLGTASEDYIVSLAEAILAGDSARALQRLEEALTGGFQMGELLDQMIGYWRDLMVLNCAGDAKIDLNTLARHRDTLTQQSRTLPLDTILAGLDVLSATRGRLQYSSHGRTLVEMALVRLGRLGQLLSIGQLTQALDRLASSGQAPATAGGPASRPAVPPEAVKKNILNPPAESAAPAGPVPLTPETLPQIWGQVLAQVGGMLALQLERAGLPAIFGPNTLALRFPSHYNGEQTYCQEPSRVARVEEILRKVLSRPTAIRIEGGPAVEPANRLTPPAESPTSPSRPRRNPKEDAEKEPLVRRALDVLGAQVVRADEGFGSPTNGEKTTGMGEVA